MRWAFSKMGTVALDASTQNPRQRQPSQLALLSHEHAGKIEAQLQAEVAELMAKAEAADQADVPDGISVPEELARREGPVGRGSSPVARAKIEARAKERVMRGEMADHEAKLAAREAKTAATGKRPGGKPPQPPVEVPLPTDQINLTDEESRASCLSRVAVSEQCYNAQSGRRRGQYVDSRARCCPGRERTSSKLNRC